MIVLLCAWLLQGAATLTPAQVMLPAPNPAIEQSALRQHLMYLASDERLGREAFTPQSKEVAEYLVAALKQAKVPGAMPDGGYLQAAPFVRREQTGPIELVLVDAQGKRHGLTYSSQFRLGRERQLDKPMKFAVQVLSADPASVGKPAADQAALFRGTPKEWRTWRDDHVDETWGLILFYEIDSKERGPLGTPRETVVPGWTSEEESSEAATPVIRVYGDLGDWGASVEALEFEPHRRLVPIDEYNVVGMIPGVGTPAEPDLAQEVIVLSAHYDHIGVLEEAAEGADRIRNGADDDASGVAVLLELAEAYAAGPPPARTVLFLFACAEEQGILGTQYFVHSPPVAFERIVCNLNLEMLGRPDELVGGAGKLWLTGFERSSLGPAFQAAGIDVVADPRLEQNFFRRSDNIVFVQEGVVAQTLSSYNLHRDYHQVSDEIQFIDFDHLTACATAALEAARQLSDGKVRPTWNEGEPKGFQKR
ncbi:MAG TPA: M20/M25/M40 family metallo-hydrolase [Planctomycetota bacterium]|nr:M20/M25/M40 family metallo-hydrolase [Planctomycetota bacterium]